MPDLEKPHSDLEPDSEDISGAQQIASKVSERVTKLAGIEKLEGFSLRDFFDEVFRRHSRDEVEEYFTVGARSTTPAIADIDTSWPRPWVFFKTFVGAVVVYFLFVQAWKEFGNLNLVPGLIMVGSFAVPISALIFFVEVNARRNVSLYEVLRLVFVGGILSLILSLVLFQVSYALELNWLGASVAGLVEEPGKLLALFIVVNVTKYRYTLNGLLFGAAVGTGFAAFESAGYALRTLLVSPDPDAMMDIIMLRGMLAPFGHIVWTAMGGAALWKVKGPRKFQFGMVTDVRFVRIFTIAVVMHMFWNSPLYLPFYGKYVIIGVVAWIIIFALIQDGLKQIREEKAELISGLT
ncbi:MAG: PrsW family glutamic-type intramembrane protease [Rhodothermia bacterium]|nr:MAG: PrsW family glutamic-type intramembrane protease [Rhodothermia bacterium]